MIAVIGRSGKISFVNDKSNVEKSWNCSLFCTGYLPNPTAVGPSDQNLVEHMDPTRFMYKFPFQRRSSFMFDPDKFSGLKDTDKITLHLKELCRENGFKLLVPRTYKGGGGRGAIWGHTQVCIHSTFSVCIRTYIHYSMHSR